MIICVLKGAFMFFSDLVKNLTISPELDFVRLASYGHKTAGSSQRGVYQGCGDFIAGQGMCWWWRISWTADTRWIFCSGNWVRAARAVYVWRYCWINRNARQVPVLAHFVGFALPAGFIVGYGLDYAERFRALPALYEIPCEE